MNFFKVDTECSISYPIRQRWSRLVRPFIILISLTAFAGSAVVASERWDFTAGMGVYTENVYIGSDDYYVTPLPSFKANFTRGAISYSISLLEGLGVTYVNPRRGFLGSVTINAGNNSRSSDVYSIIGFDVKHSDKIRTFLKDTPDLSTPYYVSAMFAYPTSVGMFGASLGYYPTTVENNQDGIEDDVRHGFLYSMLYIIQRPVTDRLSFLGMFSLEVMNEDYADAWYSVENKTEALEEFDAHAGLRDAQMVLQLSYRLSNRVSMSLDYLGTVLLRDAKRSPYTVEQLHQTVGVQTSYSF
ncbi:MAG: MipA/OmpV family protein [candidate division Zixibacteria bacterium]|nr:MipA/OmpV family protein [candidate division Zixibacteria bacterium]